MVIAPWYLAYLNLGLIVSGLLPFLVPLMVMQSTQSPGSVAYVIGAYNTGLLSAPILGGLAERYRAFRLLFFGGFITIGTMLAVLPLTSGLIAWIPLALLIGIGAAASTTVATLFIVDFVPREEWDPRIGWLQSFNGAGQLAGLLLAGVFGSLYVASGLWVAAGFALLAPIFGRIGLPAGSTMSRPTSALAERRRTDLVSVGGPEPIAGRLFHFPDHLYVAALRRLPEMIGTRFARFLSSWFAYNFGVAAFFAYYPLLMRKTFDVAPRATALVYAAAAGIGICLFVLAGRAVARYGGVSVYLAGLSLRIAGFVLLSLALLAEPHDRSVPAIWGFTLVMLAWPVLSVSGTDVTARTTAVSEGTAMGLLNGAGALATVLGTFLGGPLVERMGYDLVLILALAGLLAAVMLSRGVSEMAVLATPAKRVSPIEAMRLPCLNSNRSPDP